jgi:hypothetical protein
VTSWSLVQRSPTDCGVSECDREASIMRGPWPTGGLLFHGGGGVSDELTFQFHRFVGMEYLYWSYTLNSTELRNAENDTALRRSRWKSYVFDTSVINLYIESLVVHRAIPLRTANLTRWRNKCSPSSHYKRDEVLFSHLSFFTFTTSVFSSYCSLLTHLQYLSSRRRTDVRFHSKC